MTLFADRKVSWLLIIAAFAVAYLFNISGWLMHDDEGTDFYEVWQLQKGQRPGVDYVAEQQPLYLISGSFLVEVFGRNPLPLRLLSAVQLLTGVGILALGIRRIWGDRVAIISTGLILTTGLVYEQARLFRPDPMMLAWELIGLTAVLMAIYKKQRLIWAAAGAAYGVAFLWKPFALFPIAGLGFYFLYWLWQSRAGKNFLEPIVSGVYFGALFLAVGGGGSLLLYSRLGFYYGEIFNQHAHLGSELSLTYIAGRLILFCFLLFWVNGVYLLIFPLWFVNRKSKSFHQIDVRILVFQLVTPLVFLGISRPIYLRYFIYLIPVLAILLAWQLDISFQNLARDKVGFNRFVPILVSLLFLIAIFFTLPDIPDLFLQKESDTIRLANYIATNTNKDDIVLSDYAGLNFFADRDSIPEASIIAGGRITGGIITGDLLINRIEEFNVQMVLIHVEGGYPPPEQLIKLADYDEFRDYLKDRYVMSTVFNRAGQQIEIFQTPR